MTVSIRRGVPSDAGALAALAAITFPLATPDDAAPEAIAAFVRDVLSADRFTGYLTDPDRDVLVAEVSEGADADAVCVDAPGETAVAGVAGAVIGYAILIRGEPGDPEVLEAVTTRPTVDLNKFYVHPDQHGSGAAATLMVSAVDTARASGARSLWLGVNNENARANRFYEKHGFAVVGTRHFRLGDRLEDDFVRERPL